MNNLCRLDRVAGDRNGVVLFDAKTTPVLLRAIDAESRAAEGVLGRPFFSRLDTRYYKGSPRCVERDHSCRGGCYQLWLPHDLVSVSELKVDADGDGVYELTLAASTDYWLGPENPDPGWPYWRIDLNPNGVQLSVWPSWPRAVKVTGLFGFSNEVEATGLTGTLASAGATTLSFATGDPDASRVLFPGDTAVQGSEQMDVVSVGPVSAVVVRGINGTTAAAHAAAAVSVRRFPRDLELYIEGQVSRTRWNTQAPVAFPSEQSAPSGSSPWPKLAEMRSTYKNWRVG